MTSSGRASALRASSVSASTKSVIPWTSACVRRSSTLPLRHASAFASEGPACFDGFREREEALRRVAPAVQEDVLDPLEEILRDLLVDGELARVHDAHVEARADRVVEERRVHRLTDGRVAAERERHVRDPAGDLGEGKRLPDPARRLEEGERVAVVLFDTRRDREDVRVEDDVLGGEADLLREDPVRAGGDRELPFHGRRLAVLVERHHDHGGPVAAHEAGVRLERLLALLEAEGVHDGLALQAPQARLDHVPLRAVEHDRELRDVRLGRDEAQEPRHRGRSRPAFPRPCRRRGRSRRPRPAGARRRARPRSRPRGRASRTSASPSRSSARRRR